MKNPLVSVIIPNYNYARYLDERIGSILAQTYQNFEIIILDDCSTDNSREVIERYRSNPHVAQIVYNDVNSGSVFSQWQKGLSLAKGELIWIAESDDYCDNGLLEALVGCFYRNKGLALAFCRSILFNDEGETWTMDTKGLDEGIYSSREFISRFMSRECPMSNASACLFSKESFDKIKGLYAGMTASGDRMFWTEIVEHGNVAVVNERMNHFRKHNTNVTSRTFLAGINQREAKIVMDYILSKGYIDRRTYNSIRKKYLRKFVFEFLTDGDLKKELYDYWGYTKWQQYEFKLEAYWNRIKKIMGL